MKENEQRSSQARDFERAVSIYCGGLEAVAVGCWGKLCEHAADDPDPENHSCEPSFSRAQCDEAAEARVAQRRQVDVYDRETMEQARSRALPVDEFYGIHFIYNICLVLIPLFPVL